LASDASNLEQDEGEEQNSEDEEAEADEKAWEELIKLWGEAKTSLGQDLQISSSPTENINMEKTRAPKPKKKKKNKKSKQKISSRFLIKVQTFGNTIAMDLEQKN